MAHWPTYANPPIVEAVFSIGFNNLGDQALPRLKRIAEAVQNVYPHCEERYKASIAVQLGHTVGSTSERRQDGYVLRTQAGTKVVQLATDSLVVNHLRPYTGWNNIQTEVRTFWDHLLNNFNAVQPISVGTRYINRIDVPPLDAVENYVQTYVEIARALPQAMKQFALRIEQTIEGVNVVTQSTFVPGQVEGNAGLILDFDYSAELGHPQALWEVADTLHELKNRVFNLTITERARELFN